MAPADIIALLFAIADIDTVVSSPLPIVQILSDSFGLRGATAAFVFNLLILSFACIGIVCASSRAVWSMSRDRGFPGSLLCVAALALSVFYHVDNQRRVP